MVFARIRHACMGIELLAERRNLGGEAGVQVPVVAGTHGELLTKAGLYARLYERRFETDAPAPEEPEGPRVRRMVVRGDPPPEGGAPTGGATFGEDVILGG